MGPAIFRSSATTGNYNWVVIIIKTVLPDNSRGGPEIWTARGTQRAKSGTVRRNVDRIYQQRQPPRSADPTL